jgi:hypothetical protein
MNLSDSLGVRTLLNCLYTDWTNGQGLASWRGQWSGEEEECCPRKR